MSFLTENAKLAYAALLQAHAHLQKKINPELQKQTGISLDVYDVLLVLEDAPDGRMRVCGLADQCVFSPSGVTRLVDRLEKQGLVVRVPDPQDRRAVLVAITEMGLKKREEAWPTYRTLIEENFGKLFTESEANTIRDCLRRVFK